MKPIPVMIMAAGTLGVILGGAIVGGGMTLPSRSMIWLGAVVIFLSGWGIRTATRMMR